MEVKVAYSYALKRQSGYDAESRSNFSCWIWRFKNKEFEFVSAKSEYLWIVEVNFMVWV